jgi:hypothetical protein
MQLQFARHFREFRGAGRIENDLKLNHACRLEGAHWIIQFAKIVRRNF